MAKAARARRTQPEGLSGLNVDTDVLENPVLTEPHRGQFITQPDIDDPIEQAIQESISAREMLAAAGVTSSLNDKLDSKKKYKLFVTLRKITKFTKRLGLEQTAENFQLVPGTAQTFVPFMNGENYITGLEDKPELRKKLEKALNTDLGPRSPFYEELRFRMEDREHGQQIVIEEGFSGARMEVIYHAMIASPIIANGLQEYADGTKPMADWYIENREAEAESDQKDIDLELSAIEMFKNMSDTRRSQLSKILGLKVWGLSPDLTKSMLWKYIKTPDKSNHGVSAMKKFLKEAEKNDTEIVVKALAQDAIQYNIIRKNGAGDFVYGDENLGSTLEGIEQRIMSPRNIQLRSGIEEKVNLKSI
jgi:hypothetical protein